MLLQRILPCLFLALGGLLALFGIPWLIDALLESSIITWHSHCVSVFTRPSSYDTGNVGIGAALLQCDLI